ncbi:MAG: hypothetical protein HN560_05055 [Anaerolineae bacterium]|nr:hypothetical protein [Anaerolineae bacterium]
MAKIIFLGSSCIYPCESLQPMRDDYFIQVLPDTECPFKKSDSLTYLGTQGVETCSIVAGNLARQLYLELQEDSLFSADAVHERSFYHVLHPFRASLNLGWLAKTLEQFIGQYV